MTKLFSILICLVFTLGIIVASMTEINRAIMQEDGLRDRSVNWIEQSLPE